MKRRKKGMFYKTVAAAKKIKRVAHSDKQKDRQTTLKNTYEANTYRKRVAASLIM